MNIDFDPADFQRRQLEVWPEAAANYRNLATVEEKTVEVSGMRFHLQHNPTRAISGAAKVDKASVAARPCFLCSHNRPVCQIAVEAGDYELLLNPYPIFPIHFTLPSRTHSCQSLKGKVRDMIHIAAAMPGFTVFYNGPCCGASAPDHCHFQAGNSDFLPLLGVLSEKDGKRVLCIEGASMWRPVGLPVNCFVIDFTDVDAVVSMLEKQLLPSLPLHEGEYEPRVNVLCTGSRIIVIPRKIHRPSFYTVDGEDGVMVSPASVDLAGVMVLPRGKDFEVADAGMLRKVIEEVCFSEDDMERVGRLLSRSPMVEVGIMAAQKIFVDFEGTYEANGHKMKGRHIVSLSATPGKIMLDDIEFAAPFELIPVDTDAAFGVEGVTIGIDFHWQRRENQRFHGIARFLIEKGQVRLVNRVDVEEYLLSVISSEMSATAGCEFLKAHAVISRSWLLARLRDRRNAKADSTAMVDTCSERIKWYDHEDHELFDVCADDHCQRYQGISRQTTPEVAEAVAATRGIVLKYGEELVDARFSKCCGGVFERFSTCWQPVDHPYLSPRRDGADESDYPDLREEQLAREWIEASPDAFCNTSDAAILSQVLNSYDREDCDFYRWEVIYSRNELSEIIRNRSGIDFGEIVDLHPLERGTSGRISRLRIVGTKRTMTIGKELEIRRTLSTSHLKSSAFVVKRILDSVACMPESFILRGAGWGHGVGLCQIGAAVMGSQGYGYADILRHYYVGATLERIY